MLVDHSRKQVGWAKTAATLRREAEELGDYLAQLAPWSWFATFTFRRRPSGKWALAQVERYLQELESAAARDIAWVLVEDYDLFSRYHFHLLIAGVDHLSRSKWEIEANRRFGISQIEPYNPEERAAYYLAKKVVYEDREMHFGGGLLSRGGKGEDR